MRPILLRDACVVTMHPALGELSRGAVLIEGDRIAAVAPDIEAGVGKAKPTAALQHGFYCCASSAPLRDTSWPRRRAVGRSFRLIQQSTHGSAPAIGWPAPWNHARRLLIRALAHRGFL
jgi:hypothetical protein